jgi:flavin-dependent dehydrogenase
MPGSRFDVVIVGARCAGSALARRLATGGASVALIDAAAMPSGQRTSTHLIQPPGMDELDDLGVGAAVRALAPGIDTMRLAFDDHEARLKYSPGRLAHCLRREKLDPLIQQAAVSAGAELRDRSRVAELVRGREDRVCGVVVRREGRRSETVQADLVIGADGRHSTVAKLVQASEYLGYDGPRACYWAYWRRPENWNPAELCNFYRGDDAYVVFPTDGDELLVASAPPIARAQAWRAHHASGYLSSVAGYEPIGYHLRAQQPVSEVRGVFRTRYYFRTSVGPGWALVGDAGHHKEFFLGLGISDALRDAHSLSRAILSHEAPLTTWWRARDVERIELFCWGRELGRSTPVDALRRLTAERISATAALHSRLGKIVDGELSPFDLVPPSRALRWLMSSIAHKNLRPLPPFAAAASRRASARHELRRRRRQLALALADGCASD